MSLSRTAAALSSSLLSLMCAGHALGAAPLTLHPENPHYFLFRGKPAILIGSGEHYGAVLNLDFNYVRYLDELKSKGLNHTRTFSGAYVEPMGAFNIASNTLAPAPNRFICPWSRSTTPGYANEGNKFDLTKWDPAYFRRLKDFVGQAGKRGVVVEMNLFCPFYDEAQWKLSPQNVTNNVNEIGDVARTNVYTLDKNGGLLAVHEEMVKKIVTELKDYDNVYYEVCNEPYFGGVTMEWQHHIVDLIAETEKKLKRKHLISMNIANGSARVQNPNPAVSIFNFHYAQPPAAVTVNYTLKAVIGDNETGFRGTNDWPYRVEAWDFIVAGGGLFSHLDYSFTAGHEDGSLVYPANQPGGGNSALRTQFKILRDFMNSFEFVKMRPDGSVIKRGIPVGYTARALSTPGRAYAIYFAPTSPPKEQFSVRWTGRIVPQYSENYTLHVSSDDGVRLMINGKTLIENWSNHAEHEERVTIAFKAGQSYDLKLEYFQDGGPAVVRLAWSSPSQPKQIVPTTSLLAPEGRGRGLLGRYYVGKNFERLTLSQTDATVDFNWTAASPFKGKKPEAETQATANLILDLPKGKFRAEWVNPRSGGVEKREKFDHPGANCNLLSPPFSEDMALRIRRE